MKHKTVWSVVSTALACTMVVSALTACGGNGKDQSAQNDPPQQEDKTPATDDKTPDPEPAPEPAGDVTIQVAALAVQLFSSKRPAL